jgi:hypothetical protein
MKAFSLNPRLKHAAGAALGLGALAFTFACSSVPNASTLSAPQLTASQTGVPVVVSCQAGQRTIVRPAVINGAAVSQVECVPADAQLTEPAFGQPAAYAAPAATAYAPRAAYAPRSVSQPVYSDLGDAQVVPVSPTSARRIPARQVIYDERPVRKTRSVAKSAIIIGSSAGAGAGVGAAIGGKKGALIGAAIGGGGATIWDQVTRRKQ